MPVSSAADSISKEAIEEAAKKPLTDADIQLAKKKIKEMNQRGRNVELDMHAVTMYQAIKTVKEEANARAGRTVVVRIAPEALRNWKSEVFRKVSVLDEYWLVPKGNLNLELAHDIKGAIMDPADFSDLPVEVNDGTHYLVDMMIDRNRPGKGARRLELAAGVRDKSTASSPVAAALPAPCVEPAESGKRPAPEAAVAAPEPKRACVQVAPPVESPKPVRFLDGDP